MILWLKQLVFWLEVRFPEKVVVTVAHLAQTKAELERIDARIDAVERAAVHKEAVQDLIAVVKALKDDVTALKVNLGWGKPAGNDEIAAMLNGERI